ncbi:MAG TPA: MG2 domain-containing protein [Myxococcota bacterium]|nr:MG2 domain-containing protein [Myxococcota bacterium]
MRAKMRMGWILFLSMLSGALVASCLERKIDVGGEVTATAGLRIDESRMTARLESNRLTFDLVLQRTQARIFEGALQVELLDLDGNSYGVRHAVFNLGRDEKGYSFTFASLPGVSGLSDLGGYLFAYKVNWEGHELFGTRSAFTALEKIEAQVMAPSKMYSGAASFARVLARDPSTGKALPDVEVTVSLDLDQTNILLGRGRTDENGTAEMLITAPAEQLGSGQMIVSLAAPDGKTERITDSIELLREEKILLTTDKPIYQPGQVIHLRALSLRRPALVPVADEDLVFEVRDGKGNKVFKHQGRTNSFGIGAADFRLAREVNMGDYEISALVGTSESKKTVEVKRYALPKFSVKTSLERGFYLPGERVTGQVEARYFFGKPVSGTARIKVLTFDVGLNQIGEVSGTLNSEGLYSFGFDLPYDFAGIDLLQGDAYLQFDTEVTDLAEHTEAVSTVSVVAAASLEVSLVPDSGLLVPGLPNILHVVTADPTGMPQPASVDITAANMPAVHLETDAQGLGTTTIVFPDGELLLHVVATDAAGNLAERDVTLPVGKSGQTVILRVDRRLFTVGDTAKLDVLAADNLDRIYFDVIKGNQTLLTQAVDLEDGRASLQLDLTPDMEGNLQFDAYYLTRESQIVRDSQLVLVTGARDLDVSVTADKDVYLPGETAALSFEVTDSQGVGVHAAIGLSVVDEAVFALSDMRPGLAETFFGIEQEILKPRYQIIHSSSLNDYLDSTLDEGKREKAAEVTFAAAQGFSGGGIERNSYVDASRQAAKALGARLDRDAQDAMGGMRTLANRGIITPENLRAWLDRHGDQWYDPFGQAYRIEVRGESEWDQLLVFHTAGPDELVGSADDAESQGYYGWWIFSGQYGGGEWGFGDPMDDGERAPGECAGGMCGAPDENGGHDKDDPAGSGQSASSDPPRVRSYFPETLYVNPAVITDSDGRASVQIPLADSITTWRASSLASSLNGRIGSRSDGILVFQDFFIDVDFPATLTRGDTVSVPVAVYNYLEGPQTVTLNVQTEPWFILQDASSKSIALNANGVGVLYFTVMVDQVGWHGLTVFGYGSSQSDAVRRTVEIVPDGKEFRISRSERLEGELTRTLSIPPEAIDGASRIFVKVYPGLMSQAVEGLDAILRIPNGCFEQTTSSAWPNIMVLDYLDKSGQLTPEIELKARDYVNLSYQRIVTFECPSGGFNWWVGDDPGNDILSAMALMMFADARRAVDLDMDVVQRTQDYLESTQLSDGSWGAESHLHAGNGVYGESGLRASAFCTWGLAMSGYDGPALAAGASHLRSAVQTSDDIYANALVANALSQIDSDDPVLVALIADLAAQKIDGENGEVYWQANKGTASGAYGSSSHVETTALIAQALIRSGMYLDLVEGTLTWLIGQKDTFGTWSTTQPTVQSLRAMTMAMDLSAGQDTTGTVNVSINGVDRACVFEITPDNSDVTRICELDPYTQEGDNTVGVALDGQGSFLYQAVGVYYLPWELVGGSPDEALSLEVSYDRTDLGVDETVAVQVTVSYNVVDQTASMIMLDLGIPPGFDPLTEDLAGLVLDLPSITRYEIRGRQLSIYVSELAYGTPLTFSYRLKAKYPIHGQVPESTAWAYYNPEIRSTSVPFVINVSR